MYKTNKNTYRVLIGEPERKRPLGSRVADGRIIKKDLREVGCDAGNLINLALDRDQWQAYLITQ